MGDSNKTPKGIQALVSEKQFRRNPRGSRIGGRFAKVVFSEPNIDLDEGEDAELAYQPDGSKAFEERSRRAAEAKAVQVSETPSAPIEDVAAAPARIEVEPIVLGGASQFDSGSWQYPLNSSNVDELAHFFATVEISDAAVANLENADRTGRDIIAAEAEYERWAATQPSITRRFEKKHPEEAAALSAEHVRRNGRLSKIRFEQGLIPRAELRDVARLGGLILSVDGLDMDARVKARRMKFRMGSGEIVEAGDIWTKYELREIDGAFFNRVKYQRAD